MAAYSRVGTTGEFGNANPTIISAMVQEVAQQMLPLDRLFTVEDKAENTGTVTSILQSGVQTAVALSESATTGMGDVSAAWATTARSITQTAKGVDTYVTLLAAKTATGPSLGAIVNTLGLAVVKKLATDGMALYTEAGSGNNKIGAAGTPVTYLSHFLPGFTQIATGQVQGGVNWILATPQIQEAGAESQFAEWQKMGQAWLGENIDIRSGFLGIAPWGVNCWFSNDYTSTGGANYGIMFVQSSIKYEFVMRPTVSTDASELGVSSSSIKYGIRTIYGVNGTRDTSTTNGGVVAILS